MSGKDNNGKVYGSRIKPPESTPYPRSRAPRYTEDARYTESSPRKLDRNRVEAFNPRGYGRDRYDAPS